MVAFDEGWLYLWGLNLGLVIILNFVVKRFWGKTYLVYWMIFIWCYH